MGKDTKSIMEVEPKRISDTESKQNSDTQSDENTNTEYKQDLFNQFKNYIEGNINENWPEFIKMLHQSLIQYVNNNDVAYGCTHIKTIPTDITLLEDIIQKSNDNNNDCDCDCECEWTFVFIVLKQYPSCMYYKWSEHKDGVFKRNYDAHKAYIIDHNTPCIVGTNNIKYPDCVHCFPEENVDIKYTHLLWNISAVNRKASLLDSSINSKINGDKFINDQEITAVWI